MSEDIYGKKTKIIATVGPSLLKGNMIEATIKAGVDIFRINFSHGTTDEHMRSVKMIRNATMKSNRDVGILADISGPKIRIEGVTEPIYMKEGRRVLIYNGKEDKKDKNIYVERITSMAKAGSHIIIGDGDLIMEVSSVYDNYIAADVTKSGLLEPRKGVTIPGAVIRSKILSDKDKKDIEFAISNNADYIAISFVRSVSDIETVKKYISTFNANLPVISKIEREEALSNIEEIIKNSDGVMVARGDLGIEIDIKRLPIIQKKIINIANKQGVPVITATQMLKSMVNFPIPTRAEVTDVVNAVLDGSDAVMLSEETAVGKFPLESVSIMNDLVIEAEKNISYETFMNRGYPVNIQDREEIISKMVVEAAKSLSCRVIVAPTSSGRTAQLISRFRPEIPIIGITRHKKTFAKLQLGWGIYPVKVEKEYRNGIDEILDIINRMAYIYKLKDDDNIIITGGYPLHGTPTNLLYIYKYEKGSVKKDKVQ